ncbi:hypothetical protein [Paraflavitalea sp. CAU 1676]|uniref:hypothetical protein n=1 Tax=Paraflavitalea sp. CAU 1676 TaxID=3032598 RepID=UPI0023DB718D|nr:hypothetical protein [Paraflavitalea sp. CAU 1676]MDF2187734.1 hypothetical protein [Paraflavitalea sp. CAU 1676]
MSTSNISRLTGAIACLLLCTCRNNGKAPAPEQIAALQLKEGKLIVCGPLQSKFGTLTFNATVSDANVAPFALGLKLLHSFEYDEAEKVFAGIIQSEPSCYMAYWGIAMSNFHPLWTPPLPEELKKGATAIAIAKKLPSPTPREAKYLEAIDAFYAGYEKDSHRTRCLRFEAAMRDLQAAYPDDREAKVFYALALDAAADPADKTYQKQLVAGELLNTLYASYPDHPGVVHYLIHSYDAPGLAQNALEAARRYAALAPSSAHALHMPSHIFTRLGMWNECIQSNQEAASSAQCYAEQAGIKGHWDEELHALDYMMYGYLQQGDNLNSRKQLNYLSAIREVHPANFKVAYAFAAIPARMALENKDWKKAATLQTPSANFDWTAYPWQRSIIHFARALGAAHTGNQANAALEIGIMQQLHDTLIAQKDSYKANQVAVQINIARSWWYAGQGAIDTAVSYMELAAAMEDNTEKHPVTPAEVLPAREQLGDLLLSIGRPKEALVAYDKSMKKNPNRFNSLYGAAQAASQGKEKARAAELYVQLLKMATANSDRPELSVARHYHEMYN